MIKEHFPASNDRKIFKNNKDGALLASLCDSEADYQGLGSPPKYMNRSNNMIVLEHVDGSRIVLMVLEHYFLDGSRTKHALDQRHMLQKVTV